MMLATQKARSIMAEVSFGVDGMSGQGWPDVPYDPTGCNRPSSVTLIHHEAVKVSPAPEDLDL